jgi:cell division protein FtsL
MRCSSYFNKSLNKMADSALLGSYRIQLNYRFFKRLNVALFFAIIGVVCYMFSLKSYVQDLNFEKKQLSSQLNHEKNQINILKAELAYLNSPERLRTLSEKYLNLKQAEPQQILSENNTQEQIKTKFTGLNKKSHKNKWRYKNSNVHTVSGSKKITK